MGSIRETITLLERQQAAVENALSALRGVDQSDYPEQAMDATEAPPAKPRRIVSIATRRKISAAAKRRWAR